MPITYIWFFLASLFASHVSAQSATYIELAGRAKRCIEAYEGLDPHMDDLQPASEYADFLPEINRIFESTEENWVTRNDSIELFDLMYFFQTQIVELVDSITAHPEFDLVQAQADWGEGLGMAISPDQKLVAFSLDEKTGGTYQSRIAWVYFTGWDRVQSAQSEAFQVDGYHSIDTIQSGGEVYYVMEYYTRGCSYCFLEGVELWTEDHGQFERIFDVEVNSRSWDETLRYDAQTNTITVNYNTDDLTEYCLCADDEEVELKEAYPFPVPMYRCECLYIWNGSMFELSEGSSTFIEVE